MSEQIQLAEEAVITSHRLLERLATGEQGLELLHRDLFDSRDKVVMSALAALGRRRDPRSLQFISRLLANAEEEKQVAAVKALGQIGQHQVRWALLDLYGTGKSEALRCAILEALLAIDAQDVEALRLIQEYCRSPLVSAPTRALLVGLQLKARKDSEVGELLANGKEPILAAIYEAAESSEPILQQVVQHGADNFPMLPASLRTRLVCLAAGFKTIESVRIFQAALTDIEAEVRRSAYKLLDGQDGQSAHLNTLIPLLAGRAESSPALEEEAVAALRKLDALTDLSGQVNLASRAKVLQQVGELFARISNPERQVGSDAVELSWLIARSKEYVEYYCEESFRTAVMNFLRGSQNYSRDYLLEALKNSAVKVEVRHFEGYRALSEIIKNPKRPGIGLIGRELAIAKLGKRQLFYRLIRNLYLTRLFASAGGSEEARLFQRIYSWAKEAKLFRLAEAALFALERVDCRAAAEACQECLKPPVVSKILAIAAMQLLKKLDWAQMEPPVVKLLAGAEDAYVTLNLLDALIGASQPCSAEVIRAAVQILKSGSNEEILERVVVFLGLQARRHTLDDLTGFFEKTEPRKQRWILDVVERQAREHRVENKAGLSEFLYKILRQPESPLRGRAAVVLWLLGDDYAAQSLKDALLEAPEEQCASLVRRLAGNPKPEIVELLAPLLRSDSQLLQQALRDALQGEVSPPTRDKLIRAVLDARQDAPPEAETGAEAPQGDLRLDFHDQKKAFRFERENIQELAILFTDIQGYSKKAEVLSSLQLANLIHEYEGILFPIAESHRGQLIKKMGDGHLFVFRSCLDGALAALRIQKALKRFNNYREEAFRLIVRMGLHWGKVVRKEGDVLGNHVNIASRLETAAKGGSVLASEPVWQQISQHVHCRELGAITVKNIQEPIRVFEPYEIVIDLPENLDPAKQKDAARQPLPTAQPAAGQNGDGKIAEYVVATFSRLYDLCRKAEAGKVPFGAVQKELLQRWQHLKIPLQRMVTR